MAESTPFSFHCMVCFEDFHTDVIYPVVLPCGHTYVCNLCAERLDKCMECRIPLYTVQPQSRNLNGAGSMSPWSSGRSAGAAQRESAPNHQPPVKKRLPLPKNVVLLSLIEATELATRDVQKKYSGSPTGADMSQQALQSMTSMVDAEEEEEERIKMSTSLAVSDAGTYAVAHREGLDIFPSRPSSLPTDENVNDDDVDALVRFFHLDNKIEDAGSVDGKSASSPGQKYCDPARLGFGDRVQVVSLERGWAKLARGYGYVRADRQQLVKVGGSVDRACKLEALLSTLSTRRRELRTEQIKVDNKFIRLMSDLQASLQNDEDLTVIMADTFSHVAESPGDDADDNTILERDEKKASPSQTSPHHVDITKPVALTRQITPPVTGMRGFGCFANGVFNSFEGDEDTPGILASLSQPSPNAPNRDDMTPQASNQHMFPAVAHPSPSELRAGARAWRELHGRDAEKGINFRTGMSGHMGLLSTHSRPHDLLDSPEAAAAAATGGTPEAANSTAPSSRPSAGRAPINFRMMSSHTGLSTSASRGGGGGSAGGSGWSLGGLRLPGLGTSPRTQDSDDGTRHPSSVPHAGSM